MGQTLALADAVLKEDYHGPLREQINNGVKLSAQLDKNTEDIVGRRAIVPLHVGRNTGVGARLEGEVLPAAGNQKTVDALVPLRYLYGRIRLTKQVITRMESDRGAFVRAVKLETNGLKNDAVRDKGRQVWSTSDGKLATTGVTTAANLVVLQATTTEQMMVNFQEGMRVDIGTVANPQIVASDRLITAADITNKTITIDGAPVTTVNGTHFIFRQGNGGSGANQRELTGIQTLVASSGTLFGVDPTTTPQWASVVDSNGGTQRPLSENLLEKTCHRAENRSGMTIDSLWAEDGVYRYAANILKGRQRIVNTLDLKGGHKAIDFTFGADSYPLARDRDAVPNTLWGFAYQGMTEFVDEDWTWEDEDQGQVLRLAPDSTHSFEGIFFTFQELAIIQRNCHFEIADLEAA